MTINQKNHARVACQIALAVLTFVPGMLSAQSAVFGGDWWLKMDANRRKAYVWGFMMGYDKGYWTGCSDAIKSLPAAVSAKDKYSARAGCEPNLRAAKDDLLVKGVTDFYEHYPEDRDLMVHQVLEQLLKGLTPQQVHEHPFVRRSSSEGKP